MSTAVLAGPLVRVGRRIRLGTGTLIALAVIVGCVLRVQSWLTGRSFWLDEVYLALNITSRSFAELWRPLDHDQGAPIGFLMLVKLSQVLFGGSEQALRVVPLLAGLGSMLLFPRVARRWLPPTGAVFAVALFAVTPKLVYYSSELKQYSTDVFVTVALLAFFARPVRTADGKGGVFQWGTILGIFAIWFSHPALFVLAGLGIVQFIAAWRDGDRSELKRLLGVGALWLASFGVCWFACLRELSKNSYLMTYWTEYFAPVPPRNFEQLGWYARAVAWLFEGPASMNVADVSMAMPAVLLFAVGLWWLWKVQPRAAWMIVAPLAVTMMASALHRYPFGGRLLLFAVPLLHLGLGAGLAAVVESSAGMARNLAMVICAAVMLAPAGTATQYLIRPRVLEDHRAAAAFLADHWQPGDGVLLSSMADAPWLYYGKAMGLAPAPAILGRVNRDDWDSVRDAVTGLTGRDRLWVLVAHERGANHKALTWQLDQVGVQLDKFTAPGVAVYLYDTRHAFVGPPAPKEINRTIATATDASPIQHTGG